MRHRAVPKPRVCVECGHRGGLDDHRLSRRGTVFTFTNDYLFASPDSPVAHAVVDLGGGGRVFVQMTDCDAEAVEIDLPVELTFRSRTRGLAEELLLESTPGVIVE